MLSICVKMGLQVFFGNMGAGLFVDRTQGAGWKGLFAMNRHMQGLFLRTHHTPQFVMATFDPDDLKPETF
jgi:hypothetical protein